MEREGYWYRTNEQEFAVEAAKHAVCRLFEFANDSEQFPWAVIALHGAIQAAMIAHLNGTAGLGALDKRSAEQKWAALNGDGEYPDREHVARFGELTKRMCSASRQLEQAGPTVDMSRGTLRALWRLNSLRNDFIHFSPKGWSLEMSGLPKMIDAGVVVFRGVHSGGWLYHLEEEEMAEYGEAIDQIESVGRTIFV